MTQARESGNRAKVEWPERKYPYRSRLAFPNRGKHRWHIVAETLDGGERVYGVHVVDECENPVIQDHPDEDQIELCECQQPIEEPSLEISVNGKLLEDGPDLDITATLRFESYCMGGHWESGICDCGWEFVAENIQEAVNA